MAPLKDLIETALEVELTEHLKEKKIANRRNGKATKMLKSDYGPIALEARRERQSTFKPQLIKTRQITLESAMSNNILALWSEGRSDSDISNHIASLYEMEVSENIITGLTDAFIPKLRKWQNRPLDAIYTIIWLDVIHCKVKEGDEVMPKTIHCILGLNQKGKKTLLGMYLGSSEGTNFFLNVLTALKNRGVKDILIACIDKLKGFKEAIHSLYPETELQVGVF